MEIDKFLNKDGFDQFMRMYMISGLIKEIFTAIKIQLPKIMNCPFLLQKLIDEKYTLVGEFCDGKHFTDGDNMVYWFNLSKNGKAYNPTQTLNILKTNNIRHSKFRTVYNSESNIAELESIFTLSRTSKNEGNVLYLIDKTNNNIVLVKTKSVWYIVLRFIRQCLLRI